MSWLPGEAMSCPRGMMEGFKNSSTSVLFPFLPLGRKSEPCKEEIRFLVSLYTLPRAWNFKPLSEFQTPPARNYTAGISELIPLAPTRIYVEIVHNLGIVSLAQNFSAGTSELFPLGANSDLNRNFTLRRNFPAGV